MTTPPVDKRPEPFVELRRRSLAKALSWRVWATLATALIVVVMTGQWKLGAKVGIADTFFKFVMYFLHERLWDRIDFGRRRHPDLRG